MRGVALLLSWLVAACASNGAGAPIAYGGSPAPPPPTWLQSAAPPDSPAPAPSLSADDGEATALSAYALAPSQNDPRNPPRTHVVGRNEALYDIAVRYQIPIQSLIEQNRLEPPYALSPGATIELPPPRIRVVADGETLADVARAEGVDRRSLALLNRMREPYVVRPGDRLVLPALPGAWRDAAPAAPVSLPPPPVIATVEAPRGDGRFVWPLRGEVVARFGPQAGGRRLDGLEISAREGAPIGAAADGDVVYAGSDVPGYGALVLVRHADGYVTAYGYARRALVREGERVRAGQTLAEVGRASDGRALLLFQVRQGARAVDPAPLLGLR